MDLGQISARGVHRVIRVAWTLADLAGVPRPTADQTSYGARPVAGGAAMIRPDRQHQDRLARAALTWVAEPGDAQLGRPAAAAAPRRGRRRAHRRGRPLPGLRPGHPGPGPGLASGGRPGSATRPPGPRWMPGSGTGSGWSAPATRSGPASSTRWATRGRGRCGCAARPTSGSPACARCPSSAPGRPPRYGTHVTTELAAALAERGWTVVSGGAFGIDSRAHRGALAAEGVTVAVLPSGLDVRIRAATTSCSWPSPGTGRWSASSRRAGRRPGPGSWSATG